jgi:Holliday junction resolvase RusA-like endonuclease
MLLSIKGSVSGVPYSQNRTRGDKEAAGVWTGAVTSQTQDHARVVGPCLLRVTFRLPPSKFPKDHPYGNDLDNLLKRFCDALQTTILSEAPGKDGAIISVEATKVKVTSDAEAGADFEFVELGQPTSFPTDH